MKYGSICARARLTQVQIKAFLTNAQSFAHGDAKIFVIDLQFIFMTTMQSLRETQ
jgi:hypothetical protein